MLWEYMQNVLKSWFIYPDLEVKLILVSIGLSLAFGGFWITCHWPPLFKKYWLWVVGVFSAFFTILALVFIQIPLQYYAGQALMHFWSDQTLLNWLLLAGLPSILISGLVQEGAKMVPMVAWWWHSGRRIDAKMGLAIGAIAGAGFGLFEAVWAHNQTFMFGWSWSDVQSGGLLALIPFWERFWMLAFHISVSSLVGYGLARGRGWQFYLIGAGLHTLMNYIVLPHSKGLITTNQVEIYVAAVAALVTIAVLWLRWRKGKEEQPSPPIEPAQTSV
jgi:RsiW-degrading membrane proteinase PrsW (M82 family)